MRNGLGAAQAAIDLDRRLGQLDHLAVPLIVLAQIYQCHGDPRRALSHYHEAMTIAEEVDKRVDLPHRQIYNCLARFNPR